MRLGWFLLATLAAACFDKPERPKRVNYAGSFEATYQPTTTISFSKAAMARGDAVVVYLGCSSYMTVPEFQLYAPGWTFTPLGAPTISTGQAGASFGAIAPDTETAMFSASASSPACSDLAVLGDEFTGNTSDAAAAFDSPTIAPTTVGVCETSVTTREPYETVWAACYSGGMTTPAAPFELASDDEHGDVSEYLFAVAAPGPRAVSFTTTGSSGVVAAVAIAPR